jgi:lysophospholipase L1-like esterase
LLEIILHINPTLGLRYGSFKYKSKELPGVFKAWSYVLQPSALLGYEHVPNRQCDMIKTNSFGLVGREHPLDKQKGIYRILILGDSIAAMGWAGNYLEDDLNFDSSLKNSYKGFEVWNSGVGGYDSRQYLLYLKHKGLAFKPDAVLLFLFMNDFELNTCIYYKNKDGVTEFNFNIEAIANTGFRVNPFLMRNSYVYRFIILSVNNFLFYKNKLKGIDVKQENGRLYLGKIKQICQSQGISLYAFIFPYLNPLDKYEDYKREEYFTILKVVKELEIPHVDLYDLYEYRRAHGLSLRFLPEDDIHPDEETHKIIASMIYRFLLTTEFKSH